MKLRSTIVAPFFVLLLMVACDGDTDDAAPPDASAARPTVDAQLTVDQAYGEIVGALGEGGRISHFKLTAKTGDSDLFDDYDIENTAVVTQVWIDVELDAVRRERMIEGAAAASQSDVIVRNTRWQVGEDENRSLDALLCRESRSALLSALMTCGNYIEKSETHIEPTATFESMPGLVAIVTEGDAPGSDEHFFFTERLYVDPATWLPVASVTEGTFDNGANEYQLKSETRYEHEYVDAAPSADFFLPSAIGYVPDDADRKLRSPNRDIPQYWLGHEYDPGGDLPALRLNASHYTGDSGTPPDLGTEVIYSDEAAKAPLLAIRSFRAGEWELFSQSGEPHWWDGLASEDGALGDYRMVVYRDENGRDGARYSAHLYLNETVIEIRTFPFDDALDSREAMLAIAAGLEQARNLD